MAKVIKIEEKGDSELDKTSKYYFEDCQILSINRYKRKGKYSKKELEEEEVVDALEMFLEVNRKGKLIDIEYIVPPPHSWIVDPNLKKPEKIIKGEVYLAGDEDDDGLDIEECYTNKERDLFYIQLRKEKVVKSVEVAEDIIFDITPTNKLGGVWILNPPEELFYPPLKY